MIYLTILPMLALLWYVYRYSFLIPAATGLPILMYHKVSDNGEAIDQLTVSLSSLRRQFEYIKGKGYTPISFADLRAFNSGKSTLPAKPLIITFDDGYQSTYDLARPLLQKFNFKATVFLPVAYIGRNNAWDGGKDAIMDTETIRSASGSLIEF